MLNILPDEEKKKILTEYRLRLVVVVTFAVGALILANLVLLVPSYILSVAKYNSLSESLATQQSKQGLTGQESSIDAQVLAINKQIKLLQQQNNTGVLSPSDMILRIIERKGTGIKIQGFDYDVTGNIGSVVITGVAADRDSLAQFADTLKGDSAFSNIDLPVSSYVQKVNIDFSIVATLSGGAGKSQ